MGEISLELTMNLSEIANVHICKSFMMFILRENIMSGLNLCAALYGIITACKA